ncbi:MAG TPA: TlpA disulfide reductase family protein [Pirellulales bacterium]|nr:TlpA disulfide reductase family protein [Pirellulales bacterium]
MKVLPMPLEQTAEVFIERGAVVEIQAIDAKTGNGVPGVSFDYHTDTSAVLMELQSQTVVVDHPVTDRNGKLRAVATPGKRTFAVRKAANGYQPSEHPRLVDLDAGKTTFVRFQLQRAEPETPSPAPVTAPAGDPREQRLDDLWDRQRSLTFRGMIRYRMCRTGVAGAGRDELRAWMASFRFSSAADFLDRINQAFPDWKLRLAGPYEMTIDGDRRRRVPSSPDETGRSSPDTEVFNGCELVIYSPPHAQVWVGDVRFLRRRVEGFQDFARWGGPAEFTSAPKTITQADGKITIEGQSAASTSRLVADEQTGFAFEISSYRKTGGYGHDEWQFDPQQTAGGVILPRLRVSAQTVNDTVNLLEVYAIESIEPRDELPADAFAVAVPAGTSFYVYDSEQPKNGMTTGPVSDAVSFAEAISPRSRSLLPFVERGKPVPRLAVQTWLNQEGIVAAPELASKVVLIDFWGTGCGPCVAELPTLQTIAEKYAGTDLLIIGVHDRRAAIGELAEFAKKHGLTYVLGIDGPADEPGWFGASFKAYGVQAIPHAALIDRHGRLVLIDHLPAVIERIDGELEKQ